MAARKPRDPNTLLLNLAHALADQPRASMGQLAALAGVSRATLCRHFPSRDNMMMAMTEAGIRSAEQALARARPHEGEVHHALKRLIDELLPIAELYAYVDQQLHSNEVLEHRMQPLQASLVATFQRWQQSGALRMDMPAAWLVESMSALLRSAAALVRSEKLARKDATQNVFNMLWCGMSERGSP